MRGQKSFCATARFAFRILSSVMGAGANRLMMSTTVGSGFAAVFATAAAKHSPSYLWSAKIPSEPGNVV